MTTVASSVRSSAVWPVLVGVAVLAGAVAAGLGALSLADALTATGLPDPGPVTTYGLPFVRAAGEIAAVVAVGSFLLAAFLVPPQANGVLDAGGYRALRLGTVASGLWTVCAVLLVPLTVSDVTGQPLACAPRPVGHLVSGEPGRDRRRVALDRIYRRCRDDRQHPGAALVAHAAAVRRVIGHPAAARTDRSFVVGRFARSGHQQPAHPLGGRRAVGRRPAGAAGPRPARRRACLSGRASVLCWSPCGASWPWRSAASSTPWSASGPRTCSTPATAG